MLPRAAGVDKSKGDAERNPWTEQTRITEGNLGEKFALASSGRNLYLVGHYRNDSSRAIKTRPTTKKE